MPTSAVRIRTFLEMWRDGILAFVESGGDPRVNTDAALSTFVYVDDGTDVTEKDLAVFPSDNSPKNLKHLSDILGKYADSKGWDGFVVGDET